ncbi:MAG: DNA-binding protein [Candidatus Marinimicrobia bacterium]|nr:DNA-binding protein [Candidatus Neomarinimicrobiota bacterium]
MPAKKTRTIAGSNMSNLRMERDAALVDLRKMTGGAIKQAVVAHQMAINESAVSKLERKRLVDASVSKVKQYIEAIGGELEITIKMPDGQMLQIG